MTEPLVVQREVQIAATPATVFAFLTDPAKIVSWMGVEATTKRIRAGSIFSKYAATARRAASSGR